MKNIGALESTGKTGTGKHWKKINLQCQLVEIIELEHWKKLALEKTPYSAKKSIISEHCTL